MFTHIEVTDEDLHELARQRAVAVRDCLLKTGQLEAGRLFLVEVEVNFCSAKRCGKGKPRGVSD